MKKITKTVTRRRTYLVLPRKLYRFLTWFTLISFFGYLFTWGIGLPDYISFLFVPGFWGLPLMSFFIMEEEQVAEVQSEG